MMKYAQSLNVLKNETCAQIREISHAPHQDEVAEELVRLLVEEKYMMHKDLHHKQFRWLWCIYFMGRHNIFGEKLNVPGIKRRSCEMRVLYI